MSQLIISCRSILFPAVRDMILFHVHSLNYVSIIIIIILVG